MLLPTAHLLNAPGPGLAPGCPVVARRIVLPFLCALILLGAPWGGVSRVVAFPGAPAFELRPSVLVDSSGIHLHQVVLAPIADLPAQPVRLAAAPAFGHVVTLSRTQIETILSSVAPGLVITQWTGADAVRVSRRARPLQETELRDLLGATLQQDSVRDRGELELRFSRPWTPVLVPDETLSLRVLDLPASGLSANFIVRFELLAGQERFGPWQIVAQARVMKDVLVARVSIRRGDPLQPGDFNIERRDVLTLREPLDQDVLRNPSLDLIEGLSAGQPLLARSVRLRPIVQRGQMVDGLIRDGQMQINIRVEVLVDGLPGQLVRVRNPKNKREFYAKVQDEQTVLINL